MPYDLLSVCSDSRPLTETEEIVRMMVLAVAIVVFLISMFIVVKECVREAPQLSGFEPLGPSGSGLPKPHSKGSDYSGSSRPDSMHPLRSTSLELLPIMEPDLTFKPPVSPAAAAAAVAAVTAAQSAAAARVVAEAEAQAEMERAERQAAKEAEEVAKAKVKEEAEKKKQKQAVQEKKAKASQEPSEKTTGSKAPLEKKAKPLASSGPVKVERASTSNAAAPAQATEKGKKKATPAPVAEKASKNQSTGAEPAPQTTGKGKAVKKGQLNSAKEAVEEKRETPRSASPKKPLRDSGAAVPKATEQAPRLTRAQQKAQAKQAKKLLKQQKKKAAAAATAAASSAAHKGHSHEHMPAVDQRKAAVQGAARDYSSAPAAKAMGAQGDRLDWAKPTTSGQGMHSRHLPARVTSAAVGGATLGGPSVYGSHTSTSGMPRNFSASGALYQHTQAPRPTAPAALPQGAWKKHPHTRKRSLSDSDSDQRNSPPSKATGHEKYDRDLLPDLDNQVIPSVLNALGPDLMSPLNSPRLNGGISGMDTVGDTLVKLDHRSGGVGVIGTSLPPPTPFTTPSYLQHPSRTASAHASMQGKQRPAVRSYRGHPSAHAAYGVAPKSRYHAEEYRRGHTQMGQPSLQHQHQPHQQAAQQPLQQPEQQPLTYWSSPFGTVEPGSSSTSPLLSDVLMGSGNGHNGGRVGASAFGGAPYRGGSLFSSRDSFFFSSSDSAISPPVAEDDAQGHRSRSSSRGSEDSVVAATHSEPDVRMRGDRTPPLRSSPAPTTGSYHLF